MNEIEKEYFEWIYNLVIDQRYNRKSYKKLFSFLFSREFTYIIEMDSNRASDGEQLRYMFGLEHHYDHSYIRDNLDTRNASVLEVMIALSIRCEEHIMEDENYGNRTGQWFWNMLTSLGLGGMDDVRFNRHEANDIIDRFLAREYSPDGRGGLFTVDTHSDMRDIEIWYQMCMYLEKYV